MSQSTDIGTLSYITNQMYIYGYGVIIASGLFGNTIDIIVFLKKIKNSVCPFYLLVVDVSNTIGLLIYNLTIIIQIIYGKNGSESSVSWCRTINFVTDATVLFSPLALCLASIDRYFCSSHQANRRQWSSMKVATISIIGTILVSLLFSIPDLLYWYIDENGQFCTATAIYYKYLSYFFFPVMVCIVPVVILSISGYKTYKNLQNTIHPVSSGPEQTNNRRIDYQMARMLLVQIICHLFQATALFLMSIYTTSTRYSAKNDMRIAVENLVQAFVFCLYSTAQCSSFYIYYSQSAAFRANVKKLFVKEQAFVFRGTSLN